MSTHHAVPVSNGETAPKAGIPNVAAKDVPYFTPAQNPPSGTASDPQPENGAKPIPKLFTPLNIRGVTLQNRIMLSPLCQYSADNGHVTAWHMAHLGGILTRGPGLTTVEATAVLPEGRITPEDSGIWLDSQAEKLKEIVQFAHSQGQKIAIQLAHAGRKASTVAPWLSREAVATADVGGWPEKVMAPSAIAYNENHPLPKAMTLEDIEKFKLAWVAGAKRAVNAGFDVIEIHNAHGYLLHSFLSPVSNQRTDKYGGSWENRTRLTLEIVDLTRENIPQGTPLFLRISASDLLEHEGFDGESWTLEDSAKLAPLLAERGVDLIDVSAGGMHPAQKIVPAPGYQAGFAQVMKEAVGDNLLVGTVGKIESGSLAEGLLQGLLSMGPLQGHGKEASLDLVAVGRGFQKNPGLVWTWAEELGTEINMANQIRWGFGGRIGVERKC